MNQQQAANHSQDSKKEIILEIRKEFLREFVLRILNEKAKSIDKLPDRLIEKVKAIQMEEKNISIMNSGKIDSIKPIIPVMRALPRRQMTAPKAHTPIAPISHIPINHNIQTNPKTPFISPIQPSQPTNPSQPEQLESMHSLEKIKNLLKDRFVRSIECTGPGKPIVVLKDNIPQTTNIILNQDEIKAIMTEISSKTRIPLLPGLFRTALENVIVTAVISEFAGTRFVIEKKQMQRQFPQQMH